MKPEKELFWLAQLYRSPYTDDGWNLKFGKDGTKSDFIREFKVDMKNKDALSFVNEMIKLGVIIPTINGSRGLSKSVQLYKIKGKLLIKYANENKCFQIFKHLLDYDRII